MTCIAFIRIALLYVLGACAVSGQTLGLNNVLLSRLGLSDRQRDGQAAPAMAQQEEIVRSLEVLLAASAMAPTTGPSARSGGDVVAGLVQAAQSMATSSNVDNEALLDIFSTLGRLVDQLPDGDASFPGVRRAIVAGLALHRVRHGPFVELAQLQASERLLQQLWRMHKAAARVKGVVEFAHVSKSGGTTICQLAEQNGCATESFAANKNCEIRVFRDQPRYVNGTVHTALRKGQRTQCDRPNKAMAVRRDISCASRRKLLLSKRYTIYANEYTALGGRVDPQLAHSCSNMLTVLQIRNPRDRVLSHIRHVWATYQNHCGADRAVYFANGHDTADWAALLPAPTNNYLIRSLLGEAVFNLPSGAITEQHLALARAFLAQQYDVLLVLEDTPLSAAAMSYGLGWAEHELHVNQGQPDPEDGLPRNLDMLWDLNKLDLELYKFGVVMAQLDAVVYDMAAAQVPTPVMAEVSKRATPAVVAAGSSSAGLRIKITGGAVGQASGPGASVAVVDAGGGAISSIESARRALRVRALQRQRAVYESLHRPGSWQSSPLRFGLKSMRVPETRSGALLIQGQQQLSSATVANAVAAVSVKTAGAHGWSSATGLRASAIACGWVAPA